MDGAKRQASKEYGIRLAKALVLHARTEGPGEDVDPQTAILGATDYLAKYTKPWRQSPLDMSRTEPEDRTN
jgi:hypothetical protein